MSTFADFFGCCGKEVKEKQVTITIQERKRAQSENTSRTARIKRSVGKSPKISEEVKHSSNQTYLTLTCYSKSSKVIDKKSKYADSNSSLDHSFQEKQEVNRSFTPSKDFLNHSNSINANEKIAKFINYNRYCNSLVPNSRLQKHEHLQNFTLNTDMQMPVIKTGTPRLLLDRRFRKAKEQQGISIVTSYTQDKRLLSSTVQRRKPLVHTILQPIEERLSMPSCSQSQINDLNGNPSFPQLIRFSQSGQRMAQSSPLSEKFRSCTFDKNINVSPPVLSMARSENIHSFEEKLGRQHGQLIGNKVKIDIEIYQNELKSLMDEQKVLRQQFLFSRQMLKERIDRLDETKTALMQKIQHYENILKQKVKLAKDKEQDSRNHLVESYKKEMH